MHKVGDTPHCSILVLYSHVFFPCFHVSHACMVVYHVWCVGIYLKRVRLLCVSHAQESVFIYHCIIHAEPMLP